MTPIEQTEREVAIEKMLTGYIQSLPNWQNLSEVTQTFVGGNIRAFYYWLMRRGGELTELTVEKGDKCTNTN